MPIYRTGYVMAAIYEGDDSILLPLERLIYRFLCSLGPYRRMMRERWLYSKRRTIELYQEGFRKFLVPGAGIPTAGHVHQLFPDARVLYIDKDPDIVRMARKSLAGNPNVLYIQGDVTRWDEIEPQAVEFLGPQPEVAIVFIGATVFFTDDQLREIFRDLYRWAGPNSKMVVENSNSEPIKYELPASRIGRIVYTLTGNRQYFRTDEEFRELLGPWKVERTEPILYGVPRNFFTGDIKLPEELTEAERWIPPLLVGYKVYKPTAAEG